MPDLLDCIRSIRRRPEMYLGKPPTFDVLAAFLRGHHLAAGSLSGFQEFVVLRMDGWNNVDWEGIVRELAKRGRAHRAEPSDDEAMELLYDLVLEFLAEVRTAGVRPILHEYHSWLRAQTWYDADLQRMRSSPPPDVVTADEAAAQLGLTRQELFEALSELRLAPFRRGADVLFRRAEVEARTKVCRDGPAGKLLDEP